MELNDKKILIDEALKDLGFMALNIMFTIFSSWVVADLWNGIVAVTFEIKTITLAQALGIDILVSYIVATGKEIPVDPKDRYKFLTKCLNMAINAWLLGRFAMWLM